MTRIITESLNKKIKREYKLRFFTLLFFMISIVLLIHIALALSSYMLLSMYENIYKTSVNNQNNEIVERNEQFNIKVTQLFNLAQKIPNITPLREFEIFEKMNQLASSQISIRVFEFFDTDQITVRGVAETRDALILFNDQMKSQLEFSEFNIPLETLTKQKDISFDVTFTYHEK